MRASLGTLSRSLRHFLLGAILVVVLPGLLLGLALAWWSAQQLIDDQEQQARRLASGAAESVGNRVNALVVTAEVFSNMPLGKEHFAEFYRVAKGGPNLRVITSPYWTVTAIDCCPRVCPSARHCPAVSTWTRCARPLPVAMRRRPRFFSARWPVLMWRPSMCRYRLRKDYASFP